LSVYLRLFAPFLPFVTEEVWSWWREGSIHRAPRPSSDEFDGITGDARVLAATSEVLTAVRRAKSDARTSMRTGVATLQVTANGDDIAAVQAAEGDLLEAARGSAVGYKVGEFSVAVVLEDA
jgi:valyl-tRNA synthetase